MNTITKSLVLAIVVTLGHLGNAPSAYAITISIAEVRGGMAYVKGSDAGRKQQINWEDVDVTKANGKGNFSFEGALPDPCVVGDCDGILIAGGDPIEVSLDLPGEPPGEPVVDELTLIHEESDSHDGDSVRAVGFVEDGTEVQVVSGGADAYLRNWAIDLNQIYPLSQIGDRCLDHIVYDLDVETDIVATGEGGWKGHAGSPTLRVWEAFIPPVSCGFGLPLTETQAPIGFVYSVAVSPDKEWVAGAGFYGKIAMYRNWTSALTLFDITDSKKKRTHDLAFSSDGSLVASASTAGIQLRSFPTNCEPGNCQLELQETLSHSGSWSFSIAFKPLSISESIEMVSGSDSGKIKLWSIGNSSTVKLMESDETGAIYALAYSPNGDMIVAGGSGDITVYNSADLTILFRNEDAHAGRVNGVAFSPDSSLIVSGGADGALKLWEFPSTP